MERVGGDSIESISYANKNSYNLFSVYKYSLYIAVFYFRSKYLLLCYTHLFITNLARIPFDIKFYSKERSEFQYTPPIITFEYKLSSASIKKFTNLYTYMYQTPCHPRRILLFKGTLANPSCTGSQAILQRRIAITAGCEVCWSPLSPKT